MKPDNSSDSITVINPQWELPSIIREMTADRLMAIIAQSENGDTRDLFAFYRDIKGRRHEVCHADEFPSVPEIILFSGIRILVDFASGKDPVPLHRFILSCLSHPVLCERTLRLSIVVMP
jgi:hypothetical protein